MLQYKKLFKIVLVILSTIIIFYYTNLAKPLYSKINDGYFFDDNSCLGYLINHKPGYVCPLGVILGKIMLLIAFIQIIYIYSNKYHHIRIINFILLIIAFILSFMNIKLQQNILIAFILQLIIIIF